MVTIIIKGRRLAFNLTVWFFFVSWHINLFYLTFFICLQLSFIACQLGQQHTMTTSLARDMTAPPHTSVLDLILNHLMVRLQWCWSFEEYGIPLYCHYSKVHKVIVPVRIPSRDQIKICSHFLNLKPFNYVQRNYWC